MRQVAPAAGSWRGGYARRGTRPHPLAICAGIGAAATAVAIVVRSATAFDHGIWLVAYLFLVGCAAPWLLAVGERRVLRGAERGFGVEAVAGLWLWGTIAVPAGVLAEVRILVVAGAVGLVTSLTLLVVRAFAGSADPAPGRSVPGLAAHAALILAMAVSTVIGVLLAWSYPWL